jgi:hypothetical protein
MGQRLGTEIETRQKETHELGKEQAELFKMVTRAYSILDLLTK